MSPFKWLLLHTVSHSSLAIPPERFAWFSSVTHNIGGQRCPSCAAIINCSDPVWWTVTLLRLQIAVTACYVARIWSCCKLFSIRYRHLSEYFSKNGKILGARPYDVWLSTSLSACNTFSSSTLFIYESAHKLTGWTWLGEHAFCYMFGYK